MALALCLTLLPGLALAAEGEPGEVQETLKAASSTPRSKEIAIPEAKTGLTYDGKEQTGVAEKGDAGISVTKVPNNTEVSNEMSYGDSLTVTAKAKNAGENGKWTWTTSDSESLQIISEEDKATVKVRALKSDGSATLKATYESNSTKGSWSKEISFKIQDIRVDNIKVVDKEYDGTRDATLDTSHPSIYNAVYGNEDLRVEYNGGATFADANVGKDKVVTVPDDALQLVGKNSEHFNVTEWIDSSKKPFKGTITQATLTITDVTVDPKIYDGNTDAKVEGVTFTGMKNSETLDKEDYTATGKFEDANAGDNKKVTVTVTLNDTDTTKNYTLKDGGTFNKTDAKIDKATYGDKTANGIAKFGTEGTVDLSSLIVEGGTAKIEDTPTDKDSVLDNPSPAVADGKTLKFKFKANAGVKKTATVKVKVTSTNYADYEITVTLKVTEKKPQNPLKFINENNTTVAYGKTLQLKLEGGSTNGKVTYTTSDNNIATVDENGLFTAKKVGSVLIRADKAGNAEYEDTFGTITINITPAPLKITVSDQRIFVGDAVPSAPREGTHYTVTGLVKGDTLNGTAVMKYRQNGQYVTKPDTTKPGEYEITLTGLSTATQVGLNGTHDNYEHTILPGKLTILARPSSGGSTGGGSSSSGGGGGGSSRPSSSSGKTDTTTTTKPDGTKVQTETKPDGTKIQTETKKDGSVTKTTTNPNGSSVTETKAADGSTGTVKTDKNGQTTAETKVSAKAVEDAKKSGEPVTAPVEVEATRDSSTAPTVKIELPRNSGDTKVEIPVSNVRPGTVAVLVHPDGTEEIVKNSLPTKDGIQLTVNGGATVKIVDNSKDFIDTRSHWAKDAIDFVSARGLVNGMNDFTYAPNNSTTRAQLWTILARQNDADLSGGATWFENAQNWAKAKGISDGANPNGTINRAQMVTMLWRAMGQPAAASGASFADVPADSYYAQAVAWAVENGITAGVGGGRFDPNSTCTRGQIATFLYRYMK